MTVSPKPYLSKFLFSTVLSTFISKLTPSITIVMVHQSINYGSYMHVFNFIKYFQNIEVVAIIWTSMNVHVTSLSDSRMRNVNYLALLNFKQ